MDTDTYQQLKDRKEDSSYAKHMKDALFQISSPALLSKVVGKIDTLPLRNRDSKGDLYEYLLSKLTTAGVNGQFRTPRHVIKMMVELTKPAPKDLILDPSCGTAGFLVAASEYIRENYEDSFHKKAFKTHFSSTMFTGYDFDSSMLRISSMNLMSHGIENPTIEYCDSLAELDSHTDSSFLEANKFSLILANPPFKGSLDHNACASDLQKVVKTKKTELLFLALILRTLKPDGRCAVVVPDGVLFGSSKAHQTIRKKIVEDHKLEAVIDMPSGVFKPYAGVSTAVLLFTKTDSGGTDDVWFYHMTADGYSLDDKRTELDQSKHETNNIPDIIARYNDLKKEKRRKRSEQSFFVSKKEIVDNKYDLSINKYKEVQYDEVEYEDPLNIMSSLQELEAKIVTDLNELKGNVYG